jgi:hypothetical protein
MQPLLGRTVSQIKNRFYQSLKGKDLKNGKTKPEDLEKDLTMPTKNKRVEKAFSKHESANIESLYSVKKFSLDSGTSFESSASTAQSS